MWLIKIKDPATLRLYLDKKFDEKKKEREFNHWRQLNSLTFLFFSLVLFIKYLIQIQPKNVSPYLGGEDCVGERARVGSSDGTAECMGEQPKPNEEKWKTKQKKTNKQKEGGEISFHLKVCQLVNHIWIFCLYTVT